MSEQTLTTEQKRAQRIAQLRALEGFTRLSGGGVS